jgi:hypothetical protein
MELETAIYKTRNQLRKTAMIIDRLSQKGDPESVRELGKINKIAEQLRSKLASLRDREIALLEKTYELYDQALVEPRESYTLDSGDGRISAKYRSFEEIQGAIDRLEASIEAKRQRLCGKGIISTRLRRY